MTIKLFDRAADNQDTLSKCLADGQEEAYQAFVDHGRIVAKTVVEGARKRYRTFWTDDENFHGEVEEPVKWRPALA